MDQVKEILKQAIKYRFWIALGVSLLFPALAYVLGSGPVQAEAAEQTKKIEDAKKGVETYVNGVHPNSQYPPIVQKKTDEVARNVRNSWQKLYDRQAPLLTWPERVQERFRTWGRKWPEDVDAGNVQFAIIDYVQSYPKFVTEVYSTFRPFDYETGEGVVAAPPEATLLKPAPFKETQPPDLGKVWAAQERLWVQRALLEVVAQVNKNAKNWDTATIKQINALEVGTTTSQDQVSIVEAQTLKLAEPISDPKAPPPPDPAQGSGGEMGMPGMMEGRGMMGAQNQKTDEVYYIQPADAPADAPYKIMPVEMAVLIEQEHIQDYLAALENSPMAIQVKEFSLARPAQRVTKPEKGTSQMQYGGYGGMMGQGMPILPALARRGMGGFGGYANRVMPRNYGAMGGGPSTKSGVDRRGQDRRKKADQDKDEEDENAKKAAATDRDFNVVEVTFYGQVRFYNPPPPEPAAEPDASPGETPAGAAPATAQGEETKKSEDAAKADGKMPAEEPAKDAEKEDDAPAEKAKTEPDAKNVGDEMPAKADDAANEKTDARPGEPAKDVDQPAKVDETPKKGAEEPSAKK